MTTYINVTTLSGDRRFETKIGLDKRTIRTIGDLKVALVGVLGLTRDRFEVVKMTEALLYEEADVMTQSDWASNIVLAIRPPSRDVYDHLKTDEEDMVNGDFEDEQRTIMSCGHAIVPQTLYNYCWNRLLEGRLEFPCPSINEADARGRPTDCGTLWTLYELTVKAQLSQDERILFEMKLSQNKVNKMNGVQQCPFCRSLAVRVDEKNDRVVCVYCRRTNPNHSEFCWKCLHPWKTNTTHYCGNFSCVTSEGYKAAQEVLRTCDYKLLGSHERNSPSVRACPRCSYVIKHIFGCKEMTCDCKHIFCFICLKPWEKTRNDGGCHYRHNCNPASVHMLSKASPTQDHPTQDHPTPDHPTLEHDQKQSWCIVS